MLDINSEHYWEINIDGGKETMIGVARPSVNLTSSRLYNGSDVAFICYDGLLYGSLGSFPTEKKTVSYGKGDVLGICLIPHLDSKTFDMFVYKNCTKPAVHVWTSIPAPVVACCELWSYADRITLCPNVQKPEG